METATTTDMGVGVPLLLGAVSVLGAVAMAVYGLAGDQAAAAGSFAAAMLAGALAVSAYHVYA